VFRDHELFPFGHRRVSASDSHREFLGFLLSTLLSGLSTSLSHGGGDSSLAFLDCSLKRVRVVSMHHDAIGHCLTPASATLCPAKDSDCEIDCVLLRYRLEPFAANMNHAAGGTTGNIDPGITLEPVTDFCWR
jgi:hypothetical protein